MNHPVHPVRFANFEVDVTAGELRQNGRPVRIQELPFQILIALIDRPGEVVTRDDLRLRLWPGESFGDFDQGLNTAVNKLRDALGDSAGNPKFIETLPKRGYRFVHQIETPNLLQSPTVEPPPKQTRNRIPYYVLGAALCLVGIVGIALRSSKKSPTLPFRHFTLRFNAPTSLTPDTQLVAVSPNGRHIAIIDRQRRSTIWIQDMEQPQPRMLQGTENSHTIFWAPDSNTLGYVSDSRNLQKISIHGGFGTRLCEWNQYISSATWNPDTLSIVFASGTPSALYVVSATGGTPSLLVRAETRGGIGLNPGTSSNAADWISNPHFLRAPGGSTKLLYANRGALVLRDIGTDTEKTVGEGRHAAYSPSGHLVYRSGNDLVARRFSAERAALEGEQFLVARMATDPSVAADGTLVYRDLVSSQLVWRDRAGKLLGSLGPPADGLFYPALSRDGRRIAVETLDTQSLNIWMVDVERGTRLRLSNSRSAEVVPVWSAKGEYVAYSSYRSGNLDIFARKADAAQEAEIPIAATTLNERISDWSSDGQFILYTLNRANSDLMYLKRASGDRWESYPLLQTPANEFQGKFSPDGRYVAYLSDESGRQEAYLREFAAGGRKWPVSANGASQLRWGPGGKELFYSEAGTLVAVPVSFTGDLKLDEPRRLFSSPAFTDSGDAHYDVAPDGQKFILPERVGEQERVIHVLQNWVSGFPISQHRY